MDKIFLETLLKYLSESPLQPNQLKYFILILTKLSLNYSLTLKMPRRQQLSAIIPNRFYEIDAILKYQNVGPNMITGIIEQNKVQSKICIPKDGIELEEGKQYTFRKCFNSRNGWLYAKKPSQTVVEKGQSYVTDKFYSLMQIFQQRDALANHYVSAKLRVVSIKPKQTVKKNEQNLVLYKLTCMADNLMINMEIWNKEIDPQEVKGIVLDFIGFKIKQTTHKTVSLISTVYSKIQIPEEGVHNPERFNYKQDHLYKNISSVYELRNIEQLQHDSEQFHKNYTIALASINFLEQLNYEGCSKCKKKIEENGCLQCGSNVAKNTYEYTKVTLEDDTGMLEAAIFQEEAQVIAKKLAQNNKAAFLIKSTTKRNKQTGEQFVSHVISGIKDSINSQ